MIDKLSPGNQLQNNSFLSQTLFCQVCEEIWKMGSEPGNDCLCNIVKLLVILCNVFIVNLICQYLMKLYLSQCNFIFQYQKYDTLENYCLKY